MATSGREKTAGQQGPIECDKSGDPRGSRSNARNRTPLAIEAWLEKASEPIIRKLIDKALEGDTTALRLCCERLLPPRRDLPVAFELPLIESAADARRASASVLAACADGRLSPSEAATVMGLIATHVQPLEVAEIEARVAALGEGAKPMSFGRLRARLDRLERSHSAANTHVNSDFPIDPQVAKQLRDDSQRLGRLSAAKLEEREPLEASISELARAIGCPLSYGPIRANGDSDRRHQLWCKRMSPRGGPLNAAEDAEEAQVVARLLAFEARPVERRSSPAELAENECVRQNDPLAEAFEAFRRGPKEADTRPVRRRDDR